jgi:hypothetical protein
MHNVMVSQVSKVPSSCFIKHDLAHIPLCKLAAKRSLEHLPRFAVLQLLCAVALVRRNHARPPRLPVAQR